MTEAKTDQSKASAIAALVGLIHPEARRILNTLFIFFALLTISATAFAQSQTLAFLERAI